ncbi:MAG: HEAT repeat domain-containing protein, partial [Thermoplasmata archaeon]
MEDVRLIVDFRTGRQIDSMVFKDGKLIILELKDIGGRITASLAPGVAWRFNESGEEIELENSPFSQVGSQRLSVMEFFWNRVLDYRKPLNDPEVRSGSFRRHFGGWVVTKPGANIKFVDRDPRAVQWFTALTADDVPRSLRYERGEGLLSSEEHFDRFIDLIGAEERPWDEWMLGRRLVSTEEDIAPAGIPQIDFLFSSSKPEQKRRALQHVRELGLVDYLQDVCVASASPDKSLRKMALEILLEWDPPELGRLLVQFLHDDSPELRNHVLKLMGDRPCPEAIPELADMLKSEDFNEVVAALKALGVTEHPEAGQAVFEYAKEQPIDEMPDENVPWYTLINVLGQLSCREAVPWLLELLTDLEDLVPVGEDNHIDIIREETIYSLGEIGDSRALEPLLERLRTYTKEWTIAPIRALGRLGDPGAVDHLVPYLDTDEDWMKEEVVRALCRIGSDTA